LRVLVSARFANARENVIFYEIYERVSDCGAIVVESFACEFAVDFVEAPGLVEPVFFPEFLDYAFACFCSGRLRRAFGYLGEASSF